MKDKRCMCFSNTSECTENDCEGCPAMLKSETEIRAEAIEEFAERLRQECLNSPYKEVWLHTILKIAKEMKGEGCYANRD